MRRKITAVLAIGIILGLTGCQGIIPFVDETVATVEAPAETEELYPGPPREDWETIAAFPENTGRTQIEEEKDGVKLIVATDIHYLASELTDKGTGFIHSMEYGDGKITNYIWEITDAFVAEVLDERPDGVILSGDLSYNGEKASHLELAEKLGRIKDAGIPVLVIPGNHDINNNSAARIEEEQRLPAEKTSPEDFETIYRAFGYEDAVSRDPNSLSYMYQINDSTRILMLDTCQYHGGAQVGGMIDTDTYEWIDNELEMAFEEGVNVIPVAHHNLLEESRIYSEDCTIEHNEELLERLEGWGNIPLFLSGHLHVQHFSNSDDVAGEGVWEIVTSSLAVPPCQYGVLFFGQDRSFNYHTRILDIEMWAGIEGKEDPNLINFSWYRTPFLERVFYNQAYKWLERRKDVLTQEQIVQMSDFYATAKCYYYWGRAVEIAEEMRASQMFRLWQEYGYPSLETEYLEYILEEATMDYNSLKSEE